MLCDARLTTLFTGDQYTGSKQAVVTRKDGTVYMPDKDLTLQYIYNLNYWYVHSDQYHVFLFCHAYIGKKGDSISGRYQALPRRFWSSITDSGLPSSYRCADYGSLRRRSSQAAMYSVRHQQEQQQRSGSPETNPKRSLTHCSSDYPKRERLAEQEQGLCTVGEAMDEIKTEHVRGRRQR